MRRTADYSSADTVSEKKKVYVYVHTHVHRLHTTVHRAFVCPSSEYSFFQCTYPFEASWSISCVLRTFTYGSSFFSYNACSVSRFATHNLAHVCISNSFSTHFMYYWKIWPEVRDDLKTTLSMSTAISHCRKHSQRWWWVFLWFMWI